MKLLAIGLNPALQKALEFRTLTIGQVNRATSLTQVPGGKGYHFARAVNSLEPRGCTVVHFLGGDVGRLVGRFHEELDIPQLTVEVPGETRTCTTVLDRQSGEMTELIEPSTPIPANAVEQMRHRLAPWLATADGIGLCGTFPPGVDDEFYAWVARSKGKALLLLDGYRGVGAVLATGAVDILKVNLREVLALTGCDTADAAAAACFARFGVGCVALTDGGDRARLYTPKRAWHYTLPAVEVVNPIGAGDTVAGVMLLYRLRGESLASAFGWGLAAATASCLHLEGARFTPEAMREVHAQVKIEEIPAWAVH